MVRVLIGAALWALFLIFASLGGRSQGDIAFLPATNFWKSAVMRSMIPFDGFPFLGAGDLNGDGYVDLVFAQSDRIVVFKGDGQGKFKMDEWLFYSRKEVDPGKGVYSPVGIFEAHSGLLFDLDRDGDLDLVTSGLFGIPEEGVRFHPVLFVFQNQGAPLYLGAWENPVIWELPVALDRLWVKKLEGKEELIGAVEDVREGHYIARIYRLELEGFGFSSPVPVLDVDGRPFALCDIDKDGTVDLGVFTPERVRIFRGAKDGSFVLGPEFLPLEGKLEDVGLGDLNSDGFPDLVIGTERGVSVAIQGEAGFAEAGFLRMGWEVKRVVVGEFTGDGIPDVLALGPGRMAVLPGDGEGGLWGLGSEFSPEISGEPHVLDLNGDGLSDLLLEGALFTIVMMNGGEAWGVSRIHISGSQLFGVGDLDGDGDLDLVSDGMHGVDVLWNDGKGGFIRRSLVDLPLIPMASVVRPGRAYVLGMEEGGKEEWKLVAISSSGEVEGEWGKLEGVIPVLAAGDFDGDGVEDLAFSTKEGLVVLWGGKELVRYRLKGSLSLISSGDFDGDGVAEVAVLRGDGTMRLTIVSLKRRKLRFFRPPFVFEDTVPLGLAAGDLDGDGVSDLASVGVKVSLSSEKEGITGEVSGAKLYLWLSGSGTRELELTDFPKGDAPWFPNGLVMGDVTGDGVADLAYTTVGGSGLFILPGKGDGDFNEPKRIPVALGPLWVGDLDGNGVNEVISTPTGFSPAVWILWNGGVG